MLRRHSTVRGRPRIEIAILASVGYPTDSCALPSVIFRPCVFSSVLRWVKNVMARAEPRLEQRIKRLLWPQLRSKTNVTRLSQGPYLTRSRGVLGGHAPQTGLDRRTEVVGMGLIGMCVCVQCCGRTRL